MEQYKSVTELREYLKSKGMKKFLNNLQYYGFYIWFNWLSDLKWKIPNYFHRAWYGWGKADTWNFDYYLSKVIYQGLLWLKFHQHGYPATYNPKTHRNDYNEKRWDEIMNKMIYSFRMVKEIEEGNREFYLKGIEKKDINLFKKLNCLSKEEAKKMREGLNLFSKYYFCLWD